MRLIARRHNHSIEGEKSCDFADEKRPHSPLRTLEDLPVEVVQGVTILNGKPWKRGPPLIGTTHLDIFSRIRPFALRTPREGMRGQLDVTMLACQDKTVLCALDCIWRVLSNLRGPVKSSLQNFVLRNDYIDTVIGHQRYQHKKAPRYS